MISRIYDNTKRAEILIIVFWILIIFNLLAIFSGYLELKLLEDVNNGFYISEDEANANDTRQAVVAIAQLILFIGSVIVFLNWFRRAYANLHRIGIKKLRHSESLAVWSFIIPIVCYFWPYQIMSDIWDNTQNQIKKRDTAYVYRNDKYILGFWWTLFIISNLIGKVLFRTVFKDETIEELIISSKAMLVSDTLQIFEALLVILIVKRVMEMEKRLKVVYESEVTKLIALQEEE